MQTLMQVCVQDGKAVAIQFDYDETIVDEQGEYKGIVSKSTQTRKTDTRARYAFNTSLRSQDPPEAMMRVIDFLTEAATKPTVIKTSTLESQDTLSQAETLKPTPAVESDTGKGSTDA
jgi:hypothetical protein